MIQVKYLAEQLNKLKTTTVDSPFPSSDLYSHVKENMTPATVPLVRGYEHACHASGYLAMSDRCHTQKSVGADTTCMLTITTFVTFGNNNLWGLAVMLFDC